MTLLEAAALLRARKISSTELVEESLRRITALEPQLHAFITVTADAAVAAARNADEDLARGIDRGPLQGIPVAIKDVFLTRGVRTTAGSKLFVDYVPDHDAAVVERLARAGAVIIGKTNMHELAYGITSANPYFGAVRNPWNPGCLPGGSSGGSAVAVAAGMALAAIGTDTGGSIRIPASFCGITGLKPTYGRVSRYGVLPLDFAMDHIGPLAGSVRDCAAVLEVLAGRDSRDETSSARPVPDFMPAAGASLAGIRIGVPENFYFDRIAPGVEAAVRSAAQVAGECGATLVPVRVPDMADINTLGRVMLLAEASAIYGQHLHRTADFGADVLALLQQGTLIPATDYVNAQRLRRVKQAEFRAVWSTADVLLAPATPFTAPESGTSTVHLGGEDEDVRLAATRLVRGMNVLGLPSLSMPCGRDSHGLPIGLQLMAPEFEEARLLRVAAAVEEALAFR